MARRKLAVVGEQLTLDLDQLADDINREYHSIIGTPSERIEAAIRIGDRLLEAQRRVDHGEWYEWLGKLEVHRTTAYRYMRLAKHKDEVRATGYDGIDPAIEGISADRKARRSSAEREEMIRMAQEQGMSIDQIAETLGVSKSTVWYWTSKKNRLKRGTQRRATRARQRYSEIRTEAKTLSRELGGSVENAYSLLRRCEQQIQRVSDRESAREARTALRRALGHLHSAEDELTRAMRLMHDK